VNIAAKFPKKVVSRKKTFCVKNSKEVSNIEECYADFKSVKRLQKATEKLVTQK
jgi:hypothetical protein